MVQRDTSNLFVIEPPIQMIDFRCSLDVIGMELIETMEFMD